MKRLIYVITLFISFSQLKSQCFEIQSILVDACAGSQEGQNEMVTFQVGSVALNASDLNVNWPNNSWLGLTKNAGTAADVASVNSTIVGCGLLKEPTANILPAHSKVLLVTSSAWSPLAQSFVNLNDTLYIIFQTAGNTSGHFANSGTGLRTLSMNFSSPSGCSDVVTYNRALLLTQSLVPGGQDGGAVEFSASGGATYVNYGCQAPYIPLTVNAGPSSTICAGSSQSYTATVSGSYTSVSWSVGQGATGNFAPTNSLITTYTPGAGEIGSVKLYCTIIKTCGSQSVTVKDSVNLTILQAPNPVISASSNSVCTGQTSILSYSLTNASVSGTTSVVWLPGNINTQTISVNAANIYTVDLTNACGTNSATYTIGALPNPTVTISASSATACSGSTVSFTANSNTGNYSWNNPVSTNSMVTITANTTTTGVVTTTNMCGSDSKTYTLTVTQTPTISVNNTNVNLCAGQSFTLVASSNSPTYTWQPGGIVSSSLIVNAAGVYTVDVSNSCGSATQTVNVSFSAAPSLSIVSSAATICSNGLTTVTLSLVGSTGTYSWSTGDSSPTTTISLPGVYSASVSSSGCGIAVANISLGSAPLPVISIQSLSSNSVCVGGGIVLTANSNEGNYLWPGGATTNTYIANSSPVVVTSTNACGSSQATQTLNIVPAPTLTLSSNAVTLCSGLSATVQANSNTAVTYSWSTGATNNTVSLNTAGIYSVTVNNACGNASETLTVSAGVSPSVTASASQTLVCTVIPPTIVTATGTAGTYLWNNGANTATTSVLNSGVYTVTLTNSCGQAVSSVSVTVSSMPALVVSPQSSQLCPGSTVTLTATSSNAGNFVWSTGVTGTNSILVPTAGIYSVTVSNLCGSKTVTASVGNLTMTPIVISSNSYSICPNETATLTATGGILTGFGSSSYAWSNSTATGSVNTTTGGVVILSVTNFCGTYTQSVNVNVNPLNAAIVANPTSGYSPLVVSFSNNSINANTYLWDFGNGNIANTQNVSNQVYNTGVYTVYLTVTNGVCTDMDSVTIDVTLESPTLYVPNAFTPNGDSINDIFWIGATNIKEFNIIIFDRWGLKLFESSDLSISWTGMVNGKEVPDGCYFYLINAKGIDDVGIKKQGTVTLFK
ncbi:MAG: gliding motility-associated C-terminal domain-containing protein [Bacteroidota bacterium]